MAHESFEDEEIAGLLNRYLDFTSSCCPSWEMISWAWYKRAARSCSHFSWTAKSSSRSPIIPPRLFFGKMYRGGIFDHIGFGFCRYSTDAQFLAPHFEKMLYDNALLILAYCTAVFPVIGSFVNRGSRIQKLNIRFGFYILLLPQLGNDFLGR